MRSNRNLPAPFDVELTQMPEIGSTIEYSAELERKIIALFVKEGIFEQGEFPPSNSIFRFCTPKKDSLTMRGFCWNEAQNTLYYFASLGWATVGAIVHVVDCWRDKKRYSNSVMRPHVSPNTEKEVLEVLDALK